VSALDETPTPTVAGGLSRGLRWRPGDLIFQGLTAAAAAAAMGLVGLLAYKVIRQAWPGFTHFGAGFLTRQVWDPIKQHYGALDFIFGTVVSSFVALLIAGPLAIAIALFLTEIAPAWLRGPVGALVELLASVPSVVLGLWGILVLGPVLSNHVEPWLNDLLGWIPIFSNPRNGSVTPVGMLNAILILTIMIVPIVSSISRELFLRVPRELNEGGLALGTTRWETIRGVVIPYAAPGIVAALILGLGRAIGEAIAVTQVIGGATGIHTSLFAPADTLASRIASQYQGASSQLQIDAILYLAVILLAISLLANAVAQVVVRRAERRGVL
jgi:phosphate transport system permease protein